MAHIQHRGHSRARTEDRARGRASSALRAAVVGDNLGDQVLHQSTALLLGQHLLQIDVKLS